MKTKIFILLITIASAIFTVYAGNPFFRHGLRKKQHYFGFLTSVKFGTKLSTILEEVGEPDYKGTYEDFIDSMIEGPLYENNDETAKKIRLGKVNGKKYENYKDYFKAKFNKEIRSSKFPEFNSDKIDDGDYILMMWDGSRRGYENGLAYFLVFEDDVLIAKSIIFPWYPFIRKPA